MRMTLVAAREEGDLTPAAFSAICALDLVSIQARGLRLGKVRRLET